MALLLSVGGFNIKTLISALEWLIDTVVTVFDFFINVIESFIDIIKLFPSVLNMFTGSIANLPSVLIAFATISTILSVVYFLANRQHGG